LLFSFSARDPYHTCKNHAKPAEPVRNHWHGYCRDDHCDLQHTDRTATLDGWTDRCYTNPMPINQMTLAELANLDSTWVWKDDMMVWEDREHPIAECFAETNADDCSDD
jgi:hypothetical protein